jgi:hypothetical protein
MRRQVFYAGIFFICIDAAMTLGFGVALGRPDDPFRLPMALALGGLSFVLGAILLPLALTLWQAGYRVMPYFIAGVLFLGWWGNLASNAGFSAAMLQTEIISAANTNQVAADAREKVARLRKRDEELTKQIDFKPTFGGSEWLAPASYDAMIVRAKNETENGRNIFARSKGCTETTLASSQRVCQLIADATAAKANAEARLQWVAERKQIRAELKEAEKYSKENQVAVSSAASQAEFMARFVTASLKPGQTVMSWTTMFTALGISILISLVGWTLSAAAILLQDLRSERRPEPVQAPRYLPEPVALQTEPVPVRQAAQAARMDTYRRTTTAEEQQTDNLDRLRREMEQFLSARPELANRVSA